MSGDFRPLGSPGQEKPNRLGEVLRGQALEPSHDAQSLEPPRFVPEPKVVPASVCPQDHGDTEEHRGARPVCCLLFLSQAPEGQLFFQGGREPQGLPPAPLAWGLLAEQLSWGPCRSSLFLKFS